MAYQTGRRSTVSTARILTIIAFVCAALALFVSPLIFGIAAIALGAVGASMGDKPLGWYAAAAGAVALLLGYLLAVSLL
ncbi:putative membrane protein [Catenuloplanes nepalensis]|uniref:Membrane protein n=1 Tax=Catenuloplanes nepalensis TaxID=587533 RepID=A0ABT9MWF3_9ACTN|nr:hypothetical protein [Catenuloplanes nepalensis]MDP9795770.1 putative membrane protein [Catenuloplanes nepalensis]